VERIGAADAEESANKKINKTNVDGGNIKAMQIFPSVFGFSEGSYFETQQRLLQMASFSSSHNGEYFQEHCEFLLEDGSNISAGTFSMPSVSNLRNRVKRALESIDASPVKGSISIQNIVGEARNLHSKNISNQGVVQAASQFNFLEMVSPSGVPENGIECYKYDRTQGPSCAIACAGGTAYRNYLVPVPFDKTSADDSRRGQVRTNQLNGLFLIEHYLQEKLGKVPWQVQNGYMESNSSDLEQLNELLKNKGARDAIVERLCICVQESTDVTDRLESPVNLTQTYNSAVSIGYSKLSSESWEAIATTILDATYEATLLVGLLNAIEVKNKADKTASHCSIQRPVIYLTKVGGGVFQNRDKWIQASIKRAIEIVALYGYSLDVRIVHFRSDFPQGYDKLAGDY